MKTTIKTGTRAVIVQPSMWNPGNVTIEIMFPNSTPDQGLAATLTQDKIGALIFALEKAAEAAEISQQRMDAVAGVAAS